MSELNIELVQIIADLETDNIKLTAQVEELRAFAQYCSGMKGSELGADMMINSITNSANELLTSIGEDNA